MRSASFIRDKVQTIIQLPALPAIAEEVIEMLENPKTSASEIAKVISMDPALTAKVLKIANSAFYGFPKKISTVDFAIIVLGFETLREIVISISLVSALQDEDNATCTTQQFWDHAIYTGVIGRRLARDLGYRVSGEVFVGGLLHDMGISVLSQHFVPEYKRITEIVRNTDRHWLEVEKSVLGVTHAEIGGWLADRWNFPSTLIEAVSMHHEPLEARENPELVCIIHCADVIANRLLPNSIEWDKTIEFNPAVLERLHLDNPVVLEEYITLYTGIIEADMQPFSRMLSLAKN